MPDLVFTPPGPDQPGFLRRQRTALEFSEGLKEEPTVALFDKMIDFLLDYVTEPADRKEAQDLLLDASENDFTTMLKAISGEGDENPTPA